MRESWESDDLSRSLFEVVQMAEERAAQLEEAAAARARLYERGWRERNGHWVPPSIEWPQLVRPRLGAKE